MKNINKKLTIATATTGVLAVGIATLGNNQEAVAEKPGMEKHTGIVKKAMNDCGAFSQKAMNDCGAFSQKAMNDCGANNHRSTGMTKKDSYPNEWIYVPEGTCQKILGRTLVQK
ncbi:MAG: DUF2282 domain-containing protein [Microcoleaceae cyanobacterium MO_207.B10]|nr:DUF2282 domain-containing protein [Microcoleaceae cyanobacterium MO_207.B10]